MPAHHASRVVKTYRRHDNRKPKFPHTLCRHIDNINIYLFSSYSTFLSSQPIIWTLRGHILYRHRQTLLLTTAQQEEDIIYDNFVIGYPSR